MFVEISSTFVYAMDIKLKLKNYSALAWPKGNGTSRNLGRADNDDDDDDDDNNK